MDSMCERNVRKKRNPRRHIWETEADISTTIPIHEREWIDIEPGNYDPQCSEVAKMMNRLLRHEPLPREEDGAVEFRILAPIFASRFQVFSALFNSIMAGSVAKRRRLQEEISVLLGSRFS